MMETAQCAQTIITPENPKNVICAKNMYKELGMGFLTIELAQNFEGLVRISLDHEELARHGMTILNTKG